MIDRTSAETVAPDLTSETGDRWTVNLHDQLKDPMIHRIHDALCRTDATVAELTGAEAQTVKQLREVYSLGDFGTVMAHTYLGPRILVPAHRRAALMWAYHVIPEYGHMGADKLYGRICMHYFWEGLRELSGWLLPQECALAPYT